MNIIPIVAHRGNASEYLENSVASILSALDLGAKYIEIDIQFSSDLIPFVIHDTDLYRTHGIHLDVLSTHSSHIPLPTLYEIVELIEEHPQVTLFVEVKMESLDHHNNNRRIIEILAEAFQENDNQFVVISFDNEFIDTYLDMLPWLEAGWVLPEYNHNTLERLDDLICSYAFVDHNILPMGVTVPDFVKWVAYEVTDKNHAENLYGCGIDLIETMHVRKLSVR